MSYLIAAILGVVEGITEFLPISSTGHLIVTSRLLGVADGDFLKLFEIFIQLGAIMSVVTLYGMRLARSWKVLSRVIVAFIPTGIVGLLLYPVVKGLLGDPYVVLWSFFIGGLLLILFESYYREPLGAGTDLATMRYRDAFIIGSAQILAMVPGVSRSATTIVAGLSLGMSRVAIVEFSFLLAIPTMAAASGLELYKSRDLIHGHDAGLLAVGFLVSWVVALFVVKWLLKFVRSHTFAGFGVYRIVAALAAWKFL